MEISVLAQGWVTDFTTDSSCTSVTVTTRPAWRETRLKKATHLSRKWVCTFGWEDGPAEVVDGNVTVSQGNDQIVAIEINLDNWRQDLDGVQ